MQINYPKILKVNMQNVLRDALKIIEKNGLKGAQHLYITFKTNDNKSTLPDWLKNKFPVEMTIVIQNEYWNLQIDQKKFKIGLSFDDIKTELIISFESIISFADPHANFGLKLIHDNITKDVKDVKDVKDEIINKKNNIIEFKNFKK
tara:strand:- start:59 stop:499 length:441 start_codon:yes stop_codon:yes gene_type:complete